MPFIIGFLGGFFRTLFGRASAFIAGFLGTFIGPLVEKLARFFSNAAKTTAFLGAIVLAIGIFSAAVDGALAGLAFFAPDEFVVIGRMLMPANISTCISVLIFVRLKALVFYWVAKMADKASS